MRIVPYSWQIPIGRSWWGKTILLNLNGGSPHTKIAGVTGSGKSVAMKSLLYYLCQQQPPSNVEIHVIDLKGGATFASFENLPHIQGVYRDTEEALSALLYCVDHMWTRLEAFRMARKAFEREPRYKMIVLLIDEGGEMAPADAIGDEKKLREACMDQLSRLARVGREAGIRIIYGTQRPDKHTLPMTIRSQLENTLCFRVSENYDSEIVLGHPGAEQLPQIPGRMIYKTPAGEIPVQGVYIPDHVLNGWLSRYADTTLNVSNMQTASTNHTDSSDTLDITGILGDS